MPTPGTTRRLVWFGVPLVLLAVLAAFWNWDWFIPVVESRGSAAIGRAVTVSHLHVALGRVVTVTADGVAVANPAGWPEGDPPFATIGVLSVQVDAEAYIAGHGLVLKSIGLDNPRLLVAETKDGKANFRLATGGSGGEAPKIGDLRIVGGDAHVVIPAMKADFTAKIDTRGDGDTAELVVDAKGTYAAQPIAAKLVGGALLSLRDADHPWPVDLTIANGPTRVALKGTVADPVAFKGADVRLRFNGPDMSLLEPLAGFPIPETATYRIAGKLDLNGFDRIRFTDFTGQLGNSDIAGTIDVDARGTDAKARPVVTMDLRSERIDLTDLSGFIGGTPGHANTGSKLLPNTPVSIPRLNWADIHLRYHGAHIQGRHMPLDDLTVVMDAVDGRISVHPISFGVGKGQLAGNIELTPLSTRSVHAKVDLHLRNLDVSRMMAATHTFQGAGSVSGVGAIDATGDSLATLMGNGNGEVKMAMAGGDLSSVLVDLTGLQFGNALLSALGLPAKTPVQCFVGDLALQHGVVDFRTLVLDTGEGITNVGGTVDLGKEIIDLSLKTDSKHFSIGSLPSSIDVGGTFASPSIRPGMEVAARAGAAAGLAALFLPLAILPTIQFGTSDAEDARCGRLLRQVKASGGAAR